AGAQAGNITVETGITSASTNNLTLNAANDILIGANVDIGGKLTLNAGRDFLMGVGIGVASTGQGVSIVADGGFESTGTTGTNYLTGNITTAAGAISFGGNVK